MSVAMAMVCAGTAGSRRYDRTTRRTSAAINARYSPYAGGASYNCRIVRTDPGTSANIDEFTETDRLTDEQRAEVVAALSDRVAAVAEYVPGYRLKQQVQFSDEGDELDLLLPEDRRGGAYTTVTVFLEVEGAAMYLPEYAGNLDIMTSAALRTAEHLVAARTAVVA